MKGHWALLNNREAGQQIFLTNYLQLIFAILLFYRLLCVYMQNFEKFPFQSTSPVHESSPRNTLGQWATYLYHPIYYQGQYHKGTTPRQCVSCHSDNMLLMCVQIPTLSPWQQQRLRWIFLTCNFFILRATSMACFNPNTLWYNASLGWWWHTRGDNITQYIPHRSIKLNSSSNVKYYWYIISNTL